jgi:hypothetical protein
VENCPICRAALGGASTCRRCRADLGRAQEIERLGKALVQAAMVSFAEGDLYAARRWVQRARAVHASPAAQVLEQVLARAYARPRCVAGDDSFAADIGW